MRRKSRAFAEPGTIMSLHIVKELSRDARRALDVVGQHVYRVGRGSERRDRAARKFPSGVVGKRAPARSVLRDDDAPALADDLVRRSAKRAVARDGERKIVGKRQIDRNRGRVRPLKLATWR